MKAATPRPSPLRLETLESREVMSSSLSGGVLRVDAGAGSDVIRLEPAFSGSTAVIRVTENGSARDYAASAVRGVQVFANGGSDRVSVALTTHGVYVDGGAGNDTIAGGAAGDELRGGDGDDKLYGNGGNDRLFGQNGADWSDAGSAGELADGGAGLDYDAYVWAVGGATATDINQQQTGSCVLLSALAGAANSGRYNLANYIQYAGNDTYRVSLFVGGAWRATSVSSNGDLTRNGNAVYDTLADSEGESWQLLFQRAYMLQVGYNPYSASSMASFPGEYNGQRALSMITGRSATSYNVNGTAPTWLQNALANGGSVNTFYAGHAYTLTRAFQSGGTWYVQVYNPWGVDQVHNSNLRPYADGSNDGLMTLSWANYASTFSHFSVA